MTGEQCNLRDELGVYRVELTLLSTSSKTIDTLVHSLGTPQCLLVVIDLSAKVICKNRVTVPVITLRLSLSCDLGGVSLSLLGRRRVLWTDKRLHDETVRRL